MKRFLPLLLLALIAVPAPAVAQGSVAIAAHAGTLGLGGSLIVRGSPRVNLRGTVGMIPSEPEITVDEVDFTVDFPTFYRLTVDYYPTGLLYLSAGGLFVSGGGATDVMGTFTGTQDFGGTTYSAAEVGSLTGSFSLSGAMPYLGIGVGNPLARRVALSVDLGVGFGSVPTVELGATGPVAGDPTFLADLRARESEIEQDIPDLLRYYPVASLSLSVRLGG